MIKFLFRLFIFLFLFLPLVVSIDYSNIDASNSNIFGVNINDIPTSQDELVSKTPDVFRKSFLDKLVLPPYMQSMLNFYDQFLSKPINLLSRYIIGVEFSFSWIFFLSFALWCIFLRMFFKILSFSSLSKLAVGIVSFCMVLIIGSSRVPLRIAQGILYLVNIYYSTIEFFSTWYGILILILLVAVFIVLCFFFGEFIVDFFAKWAMNVAKMKAEAKMGEIEGKLKRQENSLGAITDGLTKKI